MHWISKKENEDFDTLQWAFGSSFTIKNGKWYNIIENKCGVLGYGYTISVKGVKFVIIEDDLSEYAKSSSYKFDCAFSWAEKEFIIKNADKFQVFGNHYLIDFSDLVEILRNRKSIPTEWIPT